jgi:hypothetical protein
MRFINKLLLLALTDLVAKTYSGLKQLQWCWKVSENEYQRKRKSLQNRLDSSYNWYLMQQRFSSGILVLILISEDYRIQNSE